MATADNLNVAQQLLATMQQITAQVERQREAYQSQAQLAQALGRSLESNGRLDSDRIREITEAIREAQGRTTEFGTGLNNVSNQIKKLSLPAEFLNGFKSGTKLTTNLFKNILSMGSPAFGLLKDIGMTLRSIPGRLMDFFQGAASGGSDPYRESLEELREEFGDLTVGTSAAIKNMTESTKNLGESGLALSRVFGYGREGLAALLRENMALFKEMGPLGDRLAASLKGVEGEFTLLRKATGLTGEAMKAFQLRAEENGMTGAQATREMTLALAQGQRAFGISVKQFGRDMEVMLKDTVTFGILAPREMVKVSAYVKKLGISMETLKKVTDKAFNFEDAAQQAAKLSEAFGIALDPLKQMEADPVKKMDNLRQAFFKTGQRYESMSAQARKYLADQAGISDEEARIAFSQKNRAMTGAQVEAQMKKQQKAQISQAEAMKTLAESVKRLVKSGEPMQGSFFDVFAKGFERGIRRSREFREVTRNLERSTRTVSLAGREVGRMFVQEFPGIKEMLKSLADMFNPREFKKLMRNVVEEFRKFFQLLQTDPKAGVEQFMKNMKKIFFDFFTTGSAPGSRFLNGAKSFFKTIGVIFIQGIKFALTTLKNLLKNIVDGRSLIPSNTGGLGSRIWQVFKDAFKYVVDELGPTIREIFSLIGTLIPQLIHKLTDKIRSGGGIINMIKTMFTPAAGAAAEAETGLRGFFLTKVLPVLKDIFKELKELGKVLMPDLIKGLFAYITPGLVTGTIRTVLAPLISSGLSTALRAAFSTGGAGPLSSFVSFLGTAAGAVTILVAAIAALTAGFYKNSKATAEISAKIGDFFSRLGEYSGMVIGTVLKYTVGLIPLLVKEITKAVKDPTVAAKFLGAFTSALMTVGNWVLQFFGGIGVGILKALGFEDLAKKLQDWLKNVHNNVKEFTSNFQANFKLIYDFVMEEFINPLINRFKRLWKSMVDAYNTYVAPVVKFIKIFVGIVVDTISGIARVIYHVFGSIATILGALFSGIYNNVTKPIIDLIVGAATWLWTKVSSIFSGIGGLISSLTSSGSSSVLSLWRTFTDGYNTYVAPIVGSISNFIDTVIRDIGRLVTWFHDNNPFTAMANGAEFVHRTVQRIFGHSVNTVVAADLRKVNGPVEDFKDRLISGITAPFNAAKEAGLAFIKNATKTFDELSTKIMEAISTFIKNLTGLWSTIFDSVKNGVLKVVREVLGLVENVGNMIIDTFTRIGLRARKAFQTIFPELVTVIKQIQTFIQPIIDRLIQNFISIKETIVTVFNFVKPIFADIAQTVIRDIGRIGTWFAEHSPFRLIERGAELVQSTIQRIHGNSINTIVNADLQRITTNLDRNDPFNAIANSAESSSQRVGHASRNMNQNLSQVVPADINVPSIDGIMSFIDRIRTIGANDREVRTNIAKFEEMLTTIRNSFVGSNGIGSKISELSQTISQVDIPENVAAKVRGVQDIVGVISTLIQSIGSITSEINSPNISANVNTTALLSSLDKILGTDANATNKSVLQVLEQYFDSIHAGNTNTRISAITTNIREQAVIPMRAMVTAYNDFIAELRNLSTGDQPLQVALTALGTTLGGRQTLAVRNAAVNAQINVQVKIEAKQIVSALETQSRNTTITNTPRFQPGLFVTAPVGNG